MERRLEPAGKDEVGQLEKSQLRTEQAVSLCLKEETIGLFGKKKRDRCAGGTPVVPASQEADTGSLEPRSSRPAWTIQQHSISKQ
jgi:hypothetical protein